MEDMRREVIRIQGQVKDFMDNPGSPVASRLHKEIQALEDDLQVGKNKYAIEDRIKEIISILDGPAKNSEIMDHQHLDMFEDKFKDLQDKARRL